MTHPQFQGYMGDKRKKLVEKFGYDCKNAAHTVRLLRMAGEFLRTGGMSVRRKDADELLQIKRGEWSIEQVMVEANRGLQDAGEAYKESPLPEKPDLMAINRLGVTVIETAYRGRKV